MRFLQRGLHALSVIVAVTLGGLVLFFVLGSVALRVEDYDSEVKWATIALGVILLTLIVWGVWKKVSYRMTLPVIGLCGGFVLYLVWDDAERPAPPDIGPVTPTDSKSYEAYRWFVKGDLHSRLAEQAKELAELPKFPNDHAQWPEFFAKHRAAFTQAWEKDALGRAWIDAMAQNAPEGVYPPVKKTEGPMLAFTPYRQSASARWGYVQVLVIDKRYDDAARLLVPFLRANFHLQRGGAILVTEMIAVVGLRGSYDQLEILVGTGKLSPEVRSEVAVALKEAPPIQLSLHNAFLGEQAFARIGYDELKKNYSDAAGFVLSVEKSKIPTNRFLWRLFFNPKRSEKLHVESLRETRELAELRLLGTDDKRAKAFEANISKKPIKNIVGQIMQQSTMAAYAKVTDVWWQTEDRRLALLKRLEAP